MDQFSQLEMKTHKVWKVCSMENHSCLTVSYLSLIPVILATKNKYHQPRQ